MRTPHFVLSPAKYCRNLSIVCFAIAACAANAPAAAATYTAIDVPGGGNTYATAVNNQGIVTGGYGAVDHRHGFVRTADGSFTLFDPKGSVYTASDAINESGQAAGFFIDANEVDHAFIRNPDGQIKIISKRGKSVDAASINRRGDICGLFRGTAGSLHGFVRTADGTFTAFDPPGSIATEPTSINDSGAIAGWFEDGTYRVHGFMRAPDGMITVLDFPSSLWTEIFALNAHGMMIGGYADGAGGHFLIRDAAGTYTSFDPGHQPTSPFGAIINDKGEIAGNYKQGPHTAHNFLKKPDSNIRHMHIPGAERFAAAFGISKNGRVVGTIQDGLGTYHGFLRTP